MAFAKFRLSKTDQRTTPVPIAAAIRQPSTQEDGYVQHDFPECGPTYGLLGSTRDQRFRCSKRWGSDFFGNVIISNTRH
jgi:hypothetical protein